MRAFVVSQKSKIKNHISGILHSSLPEVHIRESLFLFFALLFFSMGVFVIAGEQKNSEMSIFDDADQDGLSNDEEKLYGTDPDLKDSDGDSYGDGVEVESGYDPLVKAPGDRIVRENRDEKIAPREEGVGGNNLTEKMTEEIAAVLESASGEADAVTMEQVDEAVQNALSGNSQEVKLPEIDMKEIKIKKSPKDKAGEKKDVLEYVTVIAYLLATSSPQEFRSTGEVENIMNSVVEETFIALSSGNTSSLDNLAAQGETMLREAKAIEVPETMVDTHVKALQLATYATQLKSEFTPNQNDPLGQIAVFSKAQGLISVSQSFSEDILRKFEEYGVHDIPLDL